MRRISLLAILLLVPPLLAACASSKASGPAWPSQLFSVRPEGAKGPLVAYDMADGRRRFALPAGMASANGKRYFAATAAAGKTALDAFDPATGELARASTLAGEWRLGGVSASGRFVGLTRVASSAPRTTAVDVVDSRTGRVTHALRLRGSFEIDTISADGNRLFLIQHRSAADPTRYGVRLYDLLLQRLQPGALREKGADEVMTGLAWSQLASPDGRWLLTLYLNTRSKFAFIHTLDLENAYPVCVDLPSGGGDLRGIKDYSLALSPDGATVYAANPALGVVAEVDLSTPAVARTTSFPVARVTAGHGASVISGDGRTLYFASGSEVWAFDAAFARVRGPYAVGGQVTGLGFSRDDRRLYAARADGRVAVLAAASGKAMSF